MNHISRKRETINQTYPNSKNNNIVLSYLDDLNFIPRNNHQVEINNQENETNNNINENKTEENLPDRRISSREQQPSTRFRDYVTYSV